MVKFLSPVTGCMRYVLGEVSLPTWHTVRSGMVCLGEKVSGNFKKIAPGDSYMTTCILYDNLPSFHAPSVTENHLFTGRPLTEQIQYLSIHPSIHSLNNYFSSSNYLSGPGLALVIQGGTKRDTGPAFLGWFSVQISETKQRSVKSPVR